VPRFSLAESWVAGAREGRLSIRARVIRIGDEELASRWLVAWERGVMKQYLLSIYQPDGPPPPAVNLEKIMRDVHALREEMRSADAWVFSGGLHPVSTATVVRMKDGEALLTDGPFVEGKEHIGGFTIVKALDLDAALEWGRKLARATTLPIEVRPFQEEVGG
jgi:hypothetical protein